MRRLRYDARVDEAESATRLLGHQPPKRVRRHAVRRLTVIYTLIALSCIANQLVPVRLAGRSLQVADLLTCLFLLTLLASVVSTMLHVYSVGWRDGRRSPADRIAPSTRELLSPQWRR